MKWTTRIITAVAIATIFALTLAPRAHAAPASTDPTGIFVSIYNDCELASTPRPCDARWSVVATAHDAVFLTFHGYSWDGVVQILNNNDWTTDPHVALFFHDVYRAVVSTDTTDPIMRYHPDDQTAIALALDAASMLGATRFSVDVQYLR